MKKSDSINQFVDVFFDFLSSVMGNFASNIVPLLAGILPAYLTWKHITGVLLFPSWVGLAGAGVIEFLGLGAGNELMKVWEHNRRYSDGKNKMPILAPTLTAFWYVSIMVAFNVILEASPNSSFWRIVSVALFATLAVPAYALVSGKSLRTAWKTERSVQKAERLANKENEQQQSTERTTNERTPHRTGNERSLDVRQKIGDFVRSVQQNEQRTPGPSEISRTLSVSKGYASDTLQVILKEQEGENNE